jgi:hypothetical protein
LLASFCGFIASIYKLVGSAAGWKPLYGVVLLETDATKLLERISVDDEPLVLSMRKLILQAEGYRVFTAESGAQGLALFKN